MAAETLFSVSADQFCPINVTYKPTFGTILGIPTNTTFPIVACSECGFVYAGVLPSPGFLALVYDEVIDQDRGFLESVRPGWVAHQLELGRLMLDELESTFGHERALRVLDFGCGYGSLVRALTGPRVECLGFETSERRLSYLWEHGLAAVSSLDELATRAPFHGVVLSDVLEHVPEPRDTLAICRNLLVPQGLLIVNVPMFGAARLASVRTAVARNELRENEVNPWEHLNYFSPITLRRMLDAEGFPVQEGSTPIDVGLRPGLRGARKWGNAVKSLLRCIRYPFGWRPEHTCILARAARVAPALGGVGAGAASPRSGPMK